jgi:hypothetical protein
MPYTVAQIDAMSASEYSANLRDPEFIKAVDAMSPQPMTTPDMIDPETGMTVVPGTPMAPLEPVAVVPVVEPVAPVVVAPAALTEQRYEWQPTDENNIPLGGRQVIIYKTQEELIQKFTDQNTSILRQMKKLSRDARLGLTPEADVPASAARLPKNFEGFKPKHLSVDERFQLQQDLQDPAKMEDAKNKLAEATYGATPEVLSDTLNRAQRLLMENEVRRNFDEFLDRVGNGFNDIESNRVVITSWMQERDLAPTTDNFEIAFARTAVLQTPAMVVQPSQAIATVPVVARIESEPKPQVPTAAASRITSEAPSVQNARSQVPSGLNERVSSSNGASSVSVRTLTLAEVDKMSATEYGTRAKSDPTFLPNVDKLQQEADQRRAVRQRQG